MKVFVSHWYHLNGRSCNQNIKIKELRETKYILKNQNIYDVSSLLQQKLNRLMR